MINTMLLAGCWLDNVCACQRQHDNVVQICICMSSVHCVHCPGFMGIYLIFIFILIKLKVILCVGGFVCIG